MRLEVRKAYYDVDAARQQIEVARASIADSQESLRINQDRYESGLSTVTDLLAAEEAARRSADRLLGNRLPLSHRLRRAGTCERHAQSSISGGDAMNATR